MATTRHRSQIPASVRLEGLDKTMQKLRLDLPYLEGVSRLKANNLLIKCTSEVRILKSTLKG